jgi:hypothetical protein
MSKKGWVIVQHRVRDFDYWKPFFVSDENRQRDAQFVRWHITRDIGDPNNIVIVFECNDLENAKKIYSDPALKPLVEKAGVVGDSSFFFVEDVETREL